MQESTRDLMIRILGWLVVLVPAVIVITVLVFVVWQRSFTPLGPVGAAVWGLALVAWAAAIVWRWKRGA
jgi:hypothetical protein